MSVWEDEVLEKDDGDSCKTMWRYLMLLNQTELLNSIVCYVYHNLKKILKKEQFWGCLNIIIIKSKKIIS